MGICPKREILSSPPSVWEENRPRFKLNQNVRVKYTESFLLGNIKNQPMLVVPSKAEASQVVFTMFSPRMKSDCCPLKESHVTTKGSQHLLVVVLQLKNTSAVTSRNSNFKANSNSSETQLGSFVADFALRNNHIIASME